MTTTPEAVEAAKKFAEIRHLRLRNETFDEYLKAKKQLRPFLDAYEMETDCIRILAARVRELEREKEQHPQPERAKEADEVLYGFDVQDVLESDWKGIVERMLDFERKQPGESFDAMADRIEWPVRVLKFRRMKVSEKHKTFLQTRALEDVLESLDEDYADENGDYTKPTAPMQLAARRFIDEAVRHYVVWNCEPTGEVIEITREQAKEIVG